MTTTQFNHQPRGPEATEEDVRRYRKLPDTLKRAPKVATISVVALVYAIIASCQFVVSFTGPSSPRMVRLCIASVDPAKLSSQCVVCNRREFPLTVIDCTGIYKVNDLIANPLSVQEATCLIYNCRRQVPDVRPEPYHGSVSQTMPSSYYPSASRARPYELMPPSPMMGSPAAAFAHKMGSYSTASSGDSHIAQSGPYGIGSMDRQQALPFALVPTTYNTLFGPRQKAALVPLFK